MLVIDERNPCVSWRGYGGAFFKRVPEKTSV